MLNRLPEFGLERYFARWEFTAPFLLCASDIEGLKLTELLELADDESRAHWESLSLGYTESTGLPILRREIATLYDAVGADDLITFAGAEEGILVALSSLLDAGDHAVVTWPCYQSLEEIARGAGADVTRWELRESEGWEPDPSALKALIRKNTSRRSVFGRPCCRYSSNACPTGATRGSNDSPPVFECRILSRSPRQSISSTRKRTTSLRRNP